MAESRWIRFSLFLMLAFMFPEATGKYSLLGNDVTLSCAKGIDEQDRCNRTTWVFSDSKNKVKLTEHGQIHEEAKSKSDRLSVTENCSLVIKNVTTEDAGLYRCTWLRSGRQQRQQLYLYVVNMTEYKNNDEVTLRCSVTSPHRAPCGHTVKWLYEDKYVDEDNKDMNISQSECSATVKFLASSLKQSNYRELFQCEVSDDYMKNMKRFTFSPQSSAQKPGWFRFIIVSVGLAALIITVVVVDIWARTKGDNNNR